MSTITKTWTEDKIRSIIRKLDEKTRLNGATLPIKLASHGNALGYYQYAGEKKFGFKTKFINAPDTKEAEVIDVIRHEYAHYYVDVTHLERYIGHSRRETSHGDDWKRACKMVGADPTRCHNAATFSDKNWTADEAVAAYNANDVNAFDILSYLKRWHRVPLMPILHPRFTPASKSATLMLITKSVTEFSIPREDLVPLRMPSS